GGKLSHDPDAFRGKAPWPEDLVAIAVADFTGDCYPDFVVWSESRGIILNVNQKNRNHGLGLKLFGERCLFERKRKMRCNADGFGVGVWAHATALWTGAEHATFSAGLGQSRQPLFLGLGPYHEAEAVRMRWPDGAFQAEVDLAANQVHTIRQTNRKPIS